MNKETLRQMLHIGWPELYDRATVEDGRVWVGLYVNDVRAFPVGPVRLAHASYQEGRNTAAIQVVGEKPLDWVTPFRIERAEMGVSLTPDGYPQWFAPVRLGFSGRGAERGDTLSLGEFSARVTFS